MATAESSKRRFLAKAIVGMVDKKKHFPFAGELYKSKKKVFQELFFFVHFYEGNKRVLRRHIALVNKMGFDAFAFNLQGKAEDFLVLKKIPLASNGKLGLLHVYADQIEACLNLFPENKIVYGFSNPCLSLIEALARRRCCDVKAMVCDSGPAGENFLLSGVRLLQKKGFLKPVSWVLAGGMFLGWDFNLGSDLHEKLKKFPPGFPILSIRGWKDDLITPAEIDAVFSGENNLDWSKLSLPEAGHLNGLRDFSSEFIPPFSRFLERIATKTY